MSIIQYVRFLMVGGFVGLITVGIREVIGHLLTVDTVFNYSVSVTMAYIIGIVLSFLLNHRYTFQGDITSRRWRNFLLFFGVAFAGLLSTWLLSVGFRYSTNLDSLAGRFSGAIAFVLATLLSSLITYPLNAKIVFRNSASSA